MCMYIDSVWVPEVCEDLCRHVLTQKHMLTHKHISVHVKLEARITLWYVSACQSHIE